MNNDYYMYGLYAATAISLVLLIWHKIASARKAELEDSMIQGMKQIAESMKSGNSFEAAMKYVSEQSHNYNSKFFKKVLKKCQEGMPVDKALLEMSKNDEMLSYVAEIVVLTISSKGNIIASLDALSQKLWIISHLQKRVDDKASSALATLQALGIVVMPGIFYFLPGVLGLNAGVLDIYMKIYLGVIMVIFSSLNYLIFRDAKEILYVLPAGILIYLLFIFKLGNMLISMQFF